LLYVLLIRAPIDSRNRKKFLLRNNGKIILCITDAAKYDPLTPTLRIALVDNHVIHDIVIFDGTISNNKYDGFDWDTMISRESGFPFLVEICANKLRQHNLKSEFDAFFKKEIDSTQLLGVIKRTAVERPFTPR
jgi:hypothetical protein